MPETTPQTNPALPWPRRRPLLITSSIVAALFAGCGVASKMADQRTECADDGDLAAASSAAEPTVAQRVVVSTTAIDDLQSAFKQAIARAEPSVVSIYSTKKVRVASPFGFGPFGGHPFERFFEAPQQQQPREFQQQGLGSGFIIDTQGHIITNNHVVADADEIKIRLSDGRELDATVVGTDPPTDLALLRVEGENLTPIELGDSRALEVGDWVLAIGNPFGLPRTVSAGIVSAVGRANMGIVDYEDFIQTDAAVNPGNSGGPLVDLSGRVVGINTAIASRSGGNQGIAFAIPVDMAKQIVEQLRDGGKVTRGHLGIVISDLDPDMAATFNFEGKDGILVQNVQKDSPADRAGMRDGDIIVRLDGSKVDDVARFRTEIARRTPGSATRLELWRDGKLESVTVELGELPGSASAQTGGGPSKIGMGLRDLTPELRKRFALGAEQQGVVISEVEPGSPAARAGLRPGDVLQEIGNETARNAREAADRLAKADLAKGVRLRILREGSGRYVFLKTKG